MCRVVQWQCVHTVQCSWPPVCCYRCTASGCLHQFAPGTQIIQPAFLHQAGEHPRLLPWICPDQSYCNCCPASSRLYCSCCQALNSKQRGTVRNELERREGKGREEDLSLAVTVDCMSAYLEWVRNYQWIVVTAYWRSANCTGSSLPISGCNIVTSLHAPQQAGTDSNLDNRAGITGNSREFVIFVK